MSDYSQALLQIAAIVTLLVTAIISPFLGYLIWASKELSKRLQEVEKQLDKSHHRNFRARLLLTRLITFIKSFRVSVFEVVEDSYAKQTPVTEAQIRRLKNATDIDDIIENNGKIEDEEFSDRHNSHGHEE